MNKITKKEKIYSFLQKINLTIAKKILNFLKSAAILDKERANIKELNVTNSIQRGQGYTRVYMGIQGYTKGLN